MSPKAQEQRYRVFWDADNVAFRCVLSPRSREVTTSAKHALTWRYSLQ